jgi:hypothetical protein
MTLTDTPERAALRQKDLDVLNILRTWFVHDLQNALEENDRAEALRIRTNAEVLLVRFRSHRWSTSEAASLSQPRHIRNLDRIILLAKAVAKSMQP